ncbi:MULTISPECIES: hypothetical protein [unclassified Flavobacterium]|uniref:hypothetical protein n=1 Tax=unclassified Flavobacterium TaxID=196869 RepID=UPI0006AB7CE6|nr:MULTISPECIES: hypothetical protein [unclassified Flavobacterium]KOP38014.1 hypothetical protein AKO67_11970 [Flavobacterium sp. VMW]OWU90684.1 hypothetical protein APR43_11940 [Flavobacterium sp. NLM]
MKKIKLESLAFVLFIMTVLTSCSSDNDTPQGDGYIYKSAYATTVLGPTTGKVGQELIYNISFQVENGCGEFNKMTDVEFNKESGYQVEAKYPATTCSLPDPEIKKTNYKIKTNLAGTYYLRIAKSETEFIVTKVVITD